MNDQFRKKLVEAKLLVVGCGTRSIRFRPHLTISTEEVQIVLQIIRGVLRKWP